MRPGRPALTLFPAPFLALLLAAGCSSAPSASDDAARDGGPLGTTHEAGNPTDTGIPSPHDGGPVAPTPDASTTGPTPDAGPDPTAGDADLGYDAVGNADVVWGQSCLYDFGTSCPFANPQECGNHQGIAVTFPNGPQLLEATLFAGLDCSPDALNDNFNDSQKTMGTGIWMFTDDADVAGVSPSNPTSAIWWVGALTASGYPPAGAPTTGCINYTTAVPMCQ